MNMKKIAAGVGAALTLGYGTSALAAIASPGAVADAYLRVSNFTLLAGNSALGKSFTPLDIKTPTNPGGKIDLGAVATNADTSASIGATTNSQATSVGLGTPFSITSTAGGAGFVGGTTLPVNTLNPNTYAGSFTSSFGNALIPLAQPGSICGAGNIGDCVPVHNQVNLATFNSVGSAQANQNLITQFTVTVTGTTRFELNFDAEGFLRAALGQPGVSANASHSWSATVRKQGVSGNLLRWSPDGVVGSLSGTCVGAGTCTEYADAFAMTDNVGQLTTGDDAIANALGTFETELTLNSGTYTFTIAHSTNADAETAVPEPGTLALLGVGLVGFGMRRRKV